MSKKLYKVELFCYIVADSQNDAEDILADEFGPLDGMSISIHQTNSVHPEWAEWLPFGGEDDLTCQEHLEALWG